MVHLFVFVSFIQPQYEHSVGQFLCKGPHVICPDKAAGTADNQHQSWFIELSQEGPLIYGFSCSI